MEDSGLITVGIDQTRLAPGGSSSISFLTHTECLVKEEDCIAMESRGWLRPSPRFRFRKVRQMPISILIGDNPDIELASGSDILPITKIPNFGNWFPRLIHDDDLPRWCRLCGHVHFGDCQDQAPNPAFRCHCLGECPHGKYRTWCTKCKSDRAVEQQNSRSNSKAS